MTIALTPAQAVNRWNVLHRPGTAVSYRRDSGALLMTRTRTDAALLGGNRAVIWLEGMTDCVPLDRVAAYAQAGKVSA